MRTLNELARAANDNARVKGFWTQENQTQEQNPLPPIKIGGHSPETLLVKLALIHSEVSEAVEYVRKPVCDIGWFAGNGDFVCDNKVAPGELIAVNGDPRDITCKVKVDLSPLAEELSDILIRVLDLAGELGLDMDKAVADKMAANKERPYRHGKLI